MTSPGDSGPRAAARDDRRVDPDDASVTASLPAVSADRADPGRDASPYPHGSMPGAASRDDWKGPSASRSGGAGTGTLGGRTEKVPTVGGAPSFADALSAPEPERGRSPFASAAGGLPPRPGEAAAANAARGGTATATPAAPAAAARRPLRDRASAPKPARRAQLTLRRFNVWSVFKFSCMLAIALWLVWMIAVGVLYGVLDASGVVGSINDVYSQIQGSDAGSIVRPGQVLGIAAIIGVVNIVLFIALSSVFAVIYNLVSDFVGGVEVTLSERE